MEIVVRVVADSIELREAELSVAPNIGAVVEFRGVVRGEEDGRRISALRYEAYGEMAEREVARILRDEATRNACERVVVFHRHGWIPVGEVAVLVRAEARHRGPALALVGAFMDRLKQDVPIWKVEAAPC